MAEKKYYKVLKGCKYTGKHRVYSEGQVFPEDEVFGDIKVALEGQEAKVIKVDADGKEIKEIVVMPEKKPTVRASKKDDK